MVLDTGEELLADALGGDSPLMKAALAVEPFIVPYDQLARIDGWIVWLGHPPVPEGLPVLPVPDHILWDEPATALAAVAAVAADYAARRGARNADALKSTLARESPVAIVVPDTIVAGLRTLLAEVIGLGIPVLDRPRDIEEALIVLPSFALRRGAHAQPVGRLHDPALSFQSFVTSGRAGGGPLSTFVLHHEPKSDGVMVFGEDGDNLGIEIGMAGARITPVVVETLEQEAVKIPSFLNGVTSQRSGDALEIGWRQDARPAARELGEVLRVWLKALHGAEAADVRVAYAPANGPSPVLTEMHARAVLFRQARGDYLVNDQAAQ